MNKKQIFFTGLLALVMMFVSALFVGTGRILYGPDAFIIAIMGYMFMTSLKLFASLFAKGRLDA
jgi:hypothetical protein